MDAPALPLPQNPSLPPTSSKATAKGEPEVVPSQLAQKLGEFAQHHKEFAHSATGQTLFRNMGSTLAALGVYVASNAAFQRFFHHKVDGGNQALGETVSAVLSNKLVQNTLNIGVSFSLFRGVRKIWYKNYNRIFDAENATDSASQIDHLAGNVLHDIKHIAPTEFAATSIAALPLAAIKGGLLNGVKNPSFAHEMAANIPAYTVFFDTADRLYDHFCDKLQTERGGKPPTEKTTLNHSMTDMVFREGASIALGFLPYVAMQRGINSQMEGGVAINPAINSYAKDVAQGIAAFAPFTLYTGFAEQYKKQYDALMHRLNEKTSPAL